ncbi:MAG: [Clostridia bacterium]|nr:[FeFe] hydrogenase H-cluster maturation GTPase HydF [Clostridia bacterium]
MAGLNQTPSSERVHIAFFGKRNVGKSSLVNAVTGQDVSVVSSVAGTTTDAVTKSMELLPVGPVVMIDTPGLDDEGDLGELRVARTKRILNKTDVAVLVVDSVEGVTPFDREIAELVKEKNIPAVTVYAKSDLFTGERVEDCLYVSAETGENVDLLKHKIAEAAKSEGCERRIIGDRLSEGDTVILVTPIDSSAPKGRLILPQVQTIRDILDSFAVPVCVQPSQLTSVLENLKTPPKMVIVDSQVFGQVKALVPESIPLTSFSILMAAYKGILAFAVEGIRKLDRLKKGSRILISEGCTHHRQCEDIGTVKIPRAIMKYTGSDDIEFVFTQGGTFPEDLSSFDLIVHCGGCMLNEREILYRAKCAADAGVPITNYGTLLAHVSGILKRSLSCFPELEKQI